jgi:hypothetical protein
MNRSTGKKRYPMFAEEHNDIINLDSEDEIVKEDMTPPTCQIMEPQEVATSESQNAISKRTSHDQDLNA